MKRYFKILRKMQAMANTSMATHISCQEQYLDLKIDFGMKPEFEKNWT